MVATQSAFENSVPRVRTIPSNMPEEQPACNMHEEQAPSRRDSVVRQGRVERVRRRVDPRRFQQQHVAAPRDNAPLDASNGEQFDARPTSPIPAVNIPNFNSESAQRYNERFNTNDNKWYQYRTVAQTRRDNLVEIAMRTVMLMRQNRQLQEKLAILKADTKMYMEYMRNNPIIQSDNMENPFQEGLKTDPNLDPVVRMEP